MNNKKRLYKSVTDKKLSGVCGGVAEYLDLDPTIVRIVWTLVSLLWGAGVILYVIAALVMDDNPDHSAVVHTSPNRAYADNVTMNNADSSNH